MDLPVIWFGVIVVAWVLFFVLEGFDFGVGMIVGLARRPLPERDAAVRTIAPTWDGNEVWLVAAIGLMFAIFPEWYAAMLSGLYLPMVLILLGLAARGVALEFRGKYHGEGEERWKQRCDQVMAASSLLVVALWGASFAVLAEGLAINADGEVMGSGWSRSLSPLLTWPAAAGAAGAVAMAVLMGALFLSLRTTGPLRQWSRPLAIRTAGVLAAGALVVSALTGQVVIVLITLPALLAMLAAYFRREGLAFAGGALIIALATTLALAWHAPTLLPSTLDPAWSVTMEKAVVSDFAIELVSWAGLFILPAVFAYQAFSYWIFRRRISSDRVATPA
ncbi:cytochrome d ubiquinol oxidase subunit II [Kineosporia rhizophila]|uniref:cytochrome d ubiquinol oxidase subunit II n=1 Tax=Kineosporia TaxID=49184 RepID=UPI001E5775CC|nr:MULTISPECIES: cytochrome d ubiquinol oxidase subunit II [Kineosporia]MCE0538499.1 cytochrome d ubiquinol oxidase subunit II [Kineosporia rhizophila]GLY18352.1 cytochrome c oxidase assembly protein [Kineosporia sp. NBRC 101677]